MKYLWSETDIRSALAIMGLTGGMKDKRKYVLIRCPFHQDVNPSLSISLEANGIWKCFAGCGEGTFTKFIYKYYENGKERAKNIIRHFQSGATRLYSIPEKEQKKEVIIPQWQEFITDEDLKKYNDDKYYYSLRRHISEDVCRKFELGYDRATREVTFPIRDENGKCIMLCRRAIDEKRFYIPKGIPKPIAYLTQAREASEQQYGWIVVCESMYNALTCWTHGIPAVALLGVGTDVQKKILIDDAKIRGVILAFDGDEAGKIATYEWKRVLKDKKKIKVASMPDGKDINDLTETMFAEIIGNEYIKILEEERRTENGKVHDRNKKK